MKKLFIVLILSGFHTFSQTARYDSLWKDPAVEKRIAEGIEQHRKGEATLLFPDFKGTVEIEIQQIKHDFMFGSNIFMLKGFKTEAENERYEEVFKSLFNLACLPFYWKTLEPEPGKPRFAANSPGIYRRPPPDLVLEFCQKNGITPKGHTLVWDNVAHAVPTWIPADTARIQPLIDARISTLGARYGSKIKTWDVVNEVLKDHPDVPMPPEYPLKAFKTAQKHFPATTRLFINEVTGESWQNYHREYTPYKLLIDNLKFRGAKIDGIGLQFHFFSEPLHYDVVAGKAMRPSDLFRTLDLYGRYNLPLHVSEITIPALPGGTEGLENQARMTRNFYRLWFSHPAVEAIIWWNVADGTAVAGEDKWRGGFLDEALKPKPAFEVLNGLINREWKTNIKTVVSGKSYSFRGFYGDYVAKIKVNGKVVEQRFSIHKNRKNEIKLASR